MRTGGLVYAPVSYLNANKRFVDKVVLVIEGTSGIGYEATRQFLSEGANVIITSRVQEELIEAANMINSDRLKYVVWDVSDVSSFNDKLKEALSQFGVIDIFVNNVSAFSYDSYDWYDKKVYDNILDTNVKGLFFMCQAEGMYLTSINRRGKILNVSSSFDIDAHFDPYSVSNLGAICITKGLAKELVRKGIIVNGVTHGSAPVIKAGKSIGDEKEKEYIPEYHKYSRELAEEIASLLLFLASDSANSIVGQVIAANGNYSRH